MQKQIIKILVVLVMVCIANYPMYKNVKKTADDINGIVVSMREEIALWKNEVEKLQGNFEEIRNEVSTSIDKIGELKDEPKKVIDAIDSIKVDLNLKNLLKLPN